MQVVYSFWELGFTAWLDNQHEQIVMPTSDTFTSPESILLHLLLEILILFHLSKLHFKCFRFLDGDMVLSSEIILSAYPGSAKMLNLPWQSLLHVREKVEFFRWEHGRFASLGRTQWPWLCEDVWLRSRKAGFSGTNDLMLMYAIK